MCHLYTLLILLENTSQINCNDGVLVLLWLTVTIGLIKPQYFETYRLVFTEGYRTNNNQRSCFANSKGSFSFSENLQPLKITFVFIFS